MGDRVPIRSLLQHANSAPALLSDTISRSKARLFRRCAIAVLACGVMAWTNYSAPQGPARGGASPQQQPAANLTIVGVVRARDSAEPLGGLPVTLTRPDLNQARQVRERVMVRTDSAGRFSFTGLTPGRYEIRQVDLNQGGIVYPGPTVDLTQGVLHPPIAFWVTRYANISGIVYSEDGKPFVGARIDALAAAFRYGERTAIKPGITLGATLTDTNGRYSFKVPIGDEYFVRVTTANLGASSKTMEFYYPGTPFLDDAIPVPIQTPSDGAGTYISVRPVEAYAVKFQLPMDVRVLNAIDIPVYVVVRPLGHGLISQPAYPVSVQKESQNGFVTPALSPGEYELFIAYTYALRQKFPEMNWNELDPGARVRVTVADRQVDLGLISPDVRYDVTGRFNLPVDMSATVLPRFRLLPAPFYEIVTTERIVSSQSDGRIKVSGVFPGLYQLLFDPEALPKGSYVSSAMRGGQDVMKEGLKVGDRVGDIEIVISAGAGRVTGAVRDAGGLSVPETRVVLIPPIGNRGAFTEIRTVVTDSDGRFSISNVPPGEYRIVSDLSHDTRLGIRYWETPDWLRRFEPRGRLVRVEANGEARVDLEPVFR